SDRRAVGDGVPQRRQRPAPSLAALRVRTRRRRALRPALVVLVAPASCRRRIGPVPDRLWGGPLRRRVHARARRVSRPAGVGLVDGPVALAADDPRRLRTALLEPAPAADAKGGVIIK